MLIARKGNPQPSAQRAVAPFYTTRRRQAATTLGPKGRQPSPLNPLNPLNLLNPGRGAALYIHYMHEDLR